MWSVAHCSLHFAGYSADGLAIPQTVQEKQFALPTPRGPRVFMLFSQTKQVAS